jgi:hypothetical protein
MSGAALTFLISVSFLVVASAASAQDVGQVGVTMGFPASIGVIWHATDRIAVRPEIGFSRNSTEGTLSNTTGDTVNVGASLLYYLRRWDSVRTYVSPRYSYSHVSNSGSSGSTSLSLSGSTSTSLFSSDSSSGTHTLSASYGVQYMPSPHFAVYGEAGLSFSHANSTSQTSLSASITSVSGIVTSATSPPSLSTVTQWSTRGGVGVTLYF